MPWFIDLWVKYLRMTQTMGFSVSKMHILISKNIFNAPILNNRIRFKLYVEKAIILWRNKENPYRTLNIQLIAVCSECKSTLCR